MGSSVSPADREWHAICEMQLSRLAQISPLLLATTWLFFSVPPLPSLSHTHSLPRSLSPCCLATTLVNVIPLVSDWLKGRQIHVRARKGGRHACFRHRNYKLTNYSFLEYKTYACSSRPILSAHSSHCMSFQHAEPCMCVDACVWSQLLAMLSVVPS